MTSRVTVIIPNYNRQNTIGRAIESVLRQTYPNWNLIVADDGSTDRSQEIIGAFHDPRIQLVRRGQNGGNAAARNTGLDHATGDYIAFLDSDDTFEPTFLEKSLQNPDLAGEVGFSWVGTQLVDIDGSVHNKPCWQPSEKYWNNPYHFFYELHIGTGKGLVLRRECLDDGLRFDEQFRVAVDTDFLLRLRQKWKYTFVNEHLYTNYLQPGSVRTDTSKKMESYRVMLDKYGKVIHSSRTLIEKWYYKYLWLCLHNGNWIGSNVALRQLKANRTKALMLYAAFRLLPRDMAKNLHKRIAH